ncbi:DNA phosphorothioation-dependent restriction protein DptF [Pedobacter sp. Leaf170]|uniref:DNA phosphorothioation-dependent restriction protein DptF n=1 Tax=Pedobacter sp. Leaf170 TaxID=2876558 RepID=UPI001E52BC55|nr:DNA phosphorothioation-dependent restriction protein DptF [Pedobacter sp. Leaf170]
MLKIHPLIQQLSKLRESSKEAVADANVSLDDELKNFLHIKRSVETELQTLITHGYEQQSSVLIMVCGNVGDGKSHLLAKMRESKKLSSALAAFKIYNDATESFSPNETSNDSLRRILAPFTDKNLEYAQEKVILAINLGTLNNFLEAWGEEFSYLKNYVARHGIVDPELVGTLSGQPQERHFKHVNFTNRHFFNLGASGALTDPVAQLLAKIVQQDDSNPIFRGYLAATAENWAPFDPVLHNYQLLFQPIYREVIAQLIVICIVKEKQIISFRQLLNFIYDIIVPYQLSQIDPKKYEYEIAKKDVEQRISFSLPYYIFENPRLSRIFHNLSLQDPAIRRYEKMDDRIVLMFTEVDSLKWLQENYTDIFPKMSGFEADKKVDDTIISKAYLRYEFFANAQELRYKDDYFQEYLTYLYAYSNNDKDGLRGIIELIKSATYSWNGGTKAKKKIIVPSEVKNSAYRVFKHLDLRGILPEDGEKIARAEIHEFRQDLLLKFSTKDNPPEKPFEIAIDYSLFVVLKNVALGYRPNKVDRYTYIGFDRFVEQVTLHAIEEMPLFVDQINFGKPLDYVFEFNDEYNEFTFTKTNKS